MRHSMNMVEWKGVQHFDPNNPGANTPAVNQALDELGATKFHATIEAGADPKAVERELLLSFHAIKHRAYMPRYPKRNMLVRLYYWFRIKHYNLFKGKAYAQSLDKASTA